MQTQTETKKAYRPRMGASVFKLLHYSPKLMNAALVSPLGDSASVRRCLSPHHCVFLSSSLASTLASLLPSPSLSVDTPNPTPLHHCIPSTLILMLHRGAVCKESPLCKPAHVPHTLHPTSHKDDHQFHLIFMARATSLWAKILNLNK